MPRHLRLHAFIVTLLCVLCGASAVAFEPIAGSAPVFPLRLADACEGESCWNKVWATRDRRRQPQAFTADTVLRVHRSPLGRAAFTIPPQQPFSIIRNDIVTLHSRPIRLTAAILRQCDFDATSHDEPRRIGWKAYPLLYSGEGQYLLWSHGAYFYCFEPAGIEKTFRAQAWIEIKYRGQRGWWGEPANCRGPYHHPGCPQFSVRLE